ncbi:GTP-binding protein [Eubacterium sp. AF15-50]|uniref:translation factor GTPase family protein n=1 Tax=unclassified Eubacterium (in: firmicutes) TaxID=2624479 RepID=UPI000E4F600A|nr:MULTISPECIES: TetM/TetW/TetO/TetS family tetracycline resistance ribosomal protection protein [unclassified Eubacterium (in: firmicutes)]RHR74318.1 GTP-binding protein [Eubacterium sp. AF16-48]RHR81852.1 GTP-binding protein [Eubacterium sp. AF15-50]
MRKITLGILAHVDGGKTTLSESVLYLTGKIRKLGRVDHKDAYLDNFQMERDRGITIFSKQAVFEYKDMEVTLLDTPGHVDFSTEMERTLQVLDYAVLLVSASDGIQGHTETLWKLLARYQIPTFIFVNKMDMPNVSGDFVLHELKEKFGDNIVRFQGDVGILEDIAMTDENVLEEYMETGNISQETITELIFGRKLFPCYFGAALKLEGVEDLLEGIFKYTFETVYSDKFGAKIYKISKDNNGNRLTHMKITGGKLSVKESIKGSSIDSGEWEEKVNEIRIYSGEKYQPVGSVVAGDVCAVTGLTKTCSGQGLGQEEESEPPGLIPVLCYKIIPPDEVNINQAYLKIKELEEEDPTLQLKWNGEKQEITANVMGPIQIQVLKQLIKERFDMDVEFGSAGILYKETIGDSVIGVGHFEPLRHYAEVHLLLEPAEPGSGIILDSKVKENDLTKNWQRLILTHLAEKEHKGVLTGAPITDICITIVAGKAHLKHTEGGDFRQATYRAVRQGLKKAKSVLLEPYYDFTLDVPADCVGRAMNDISRMYGYTNPPQLSESNATLKGYAPVSEIWNYITEVNEYTHGKGRLTLKYKGYAPCHNEEEVINEIGYDSESDVNNPTGSVFCAHGAGFNVPWDLVEDYMHLKDETNLNNIEVGEITTINTDTPSKTRLNTYAGDKELEEIFERTFGKIKRKKIATPTVRRYDSKPKVYKGNNKNNLAECVLVDGYNIIFAWDELKELAKDNIDGARDKLLDIMSNYQGYKGCTVIVVFDAYNVKRHTETVYKHDNVFVVYTRAAETADMYIAKTTHKMSSKYKVTVATSDALEQLIIMGHGALRMSAMNFLEEVKRVENLISESINKGI